MVAARQIDEIVEVTSMAHSLDFQKLGHLDYLVSGKPVNFRQCELTDAKSQMIDLIAIKMQSAMGPYSHWDDPYGK